jgi:cyclopropane-fatty-acyl-phospholipid synthase
MFDAAPANSQQGRRRVLRAGLDRMLRSFELEGSLTLRYPDGSETVFSGQPGPARAFEIKTWAAARRILINPNLAFGEAYVDGSLVPLGCTVYDLLDTLLAARRRGGLGTIVGLRESLDRIGKRWTQLNPARRALRNVAHHYDLNGTLYSLLLDHDRQYSCAYFRDGDETLDEAQVAKKRHIASKLLLTRPGLRVLDIGCGWGGMALTLAKDYGADVTGITLSQEQLEVARARAEAEGLADRVRFELLDYRSVPHTVDRPAFDRIVSVGMFEHVGINHYRRFFQVVHRCLEPDGVALIHAIGRSYGPETTNPWIRKYIFPGGYSPALSEVLPAVEKSGLIATDIEILRMHYARTLECWRNNLERNRETITGLYDERFMRMFEFYLSGSELAFRHAGHMVWQMQMARQHAAVPLTRDYIKE